MIQALHVSSYGRGSPVLVLLHGLGANGHVWDQVIAGLRTWPGEIIAPDLLGHGRSPHVPDYSYESHAAAVGALIEPNRPLVIVGHSMGAAIGSSLASVHPVQTKLLLGIGLKMRWKQDEVDKINAFSRAPARRFDTKGEAITRFFKVSGLTGLVSDDSPVAEAGISNDNGQYRLSADPMAATVVGQAVGLSRMPASVRVRLARGARDNLVDLQELRDFDPHALSIEGGGHNVHVEAPEAVIDLVLSELRATS